MTYTHTDVTIETSYGDTISIKAENAGFMLAKGLMFRAGLPDDGGMLFRFMSEKKWEFWMENTLIPLDIIFINKYLEVVDIKKGIPHDRTPIIPNKNAKYVLEVNIDWCAKNGVEVGDIVYFN